MDSVRSTPNGIGNIQYIKLFSAHRCEFTVGYYVLYLIHKKLYELGWRKKNSERLKFPWACQLLRNPYLLDTAANKGVLGCVRKSSWFSPWSQLRSCPQAANGVLGSCISLFRHVASFTLLQRAIFRSTHAWAPTIGHFSAAEFHSRIRGALPSSTLCAANLFTLAPVFSWPVLPHLSRWTLVMEYPGNEEGLQLWNIDISCPLHVLYFSSTSYNISC